jgi:hypothetical protein
MGCPSETKWWKYGDVMHTRQCSLYRRVLWAVSPTSLIINWQRVSDTANQTSKNRARTVVPGFTASLVTRQFLFNVSKQHAHWRHHWCVTMTSSGTRCNCKPWSMTAHFYSLLSNLPSLCAYCPDRASSLLAVRLCNEPVAFVTEATLTYISDRSVARSGLTITYLQNIPQDFRHLFVVPTNWEPLFK